MDPTQQIPPFVHPDPVSTALFVALVFGLVGAFVAGIRAVQPEWTTRAAVAGVGWLALGWIATASGATAMSTPVPGAVWFLGGSLLAMAGLALSPVGTRLGALPLVALIGVQAFRVPLEVLLHSWYGQGTLPVQMTWEGQNPDIISGLMALAWVGAARWNPPRWTAWLTQLVGLGLLANVVRVAVTSAPLPIRQFWNDPPVLLPFHTPFMWIVSVCVAGALFAHIVTIRALLRTPGDPPSDQKAQ